MESPMSWSKIFLVSFIAVIMFFPEIDNGNGIYINRIFAAVLLALMAIISLIKYIKENNIVKKSKSKAGQLSDLYHRCPHCKTVIRSDASVCKNCHRDI